MQDMKRQASAIPTGSWLAHERQRLGKTLGDVAQAVHGHVATVRALEQNNRVIPPGWYPNLRKLGMHVAEPAWPVQMTPYCGKDLNADLQNRTGFRHSRYWLSKQLCVSELAVTGVIGDNLVVPPSWLLKLAELGANVPASVRMALYLSDSGSIFPESAAPRGSMGANAGGPSPMGAIGARLAGELKTGMEQSEAHAQISENTQPAKSVGPQHTGQPSFLEEPTVNKPGVGGDAPVTASAQRAQSSVSLNWTQDGGLHFSISAALLEQIPSGLKELLIVLAQVGQQSARPGQSAPAPRI